MQAATVLDPKVREYAERRLALDQAMDRLFRTIFGCSHRRLSRPFTSQGKTYRTCLKCGMHRDFDLRTWKTFGPYHATGPRAL